MGIFQIATKYLMMLLLFLQTKEPSRDTDSAVLCYITFK